MNVPSADLQRLLAEEPFVRSLAASLLADEADDVVQLAYLRALEHRPAGLREPRAWLARIVRNLVADRRRRRLRYDARVSGGVNANASASVPGEVPHPLVPSSAELAEGEERRRALVAAVDELAEPLRTVVLLRWFEGLPPRRIARELGVPASVVWNRLHAALVALRARLDREYGGDRRAWALPLVPFATTPRGLPWGEVVWTSTPAATPALVLGVLAMTTKLKVALATAVVLVGALAWVVWGNGAPGPRLADDVAVRAPAPAHGNVPAQPDADAATPEPDAARQVATTATPPATTGSVVATVRYASEPVIASDVVVVFSRPGDDLRVSGVRAVTDAEGKARFDGLAPGPGRLSVPGREVVRVKVTVEAGATQECTLQERLGMTLTGVVVDATGTPIAGAHVETVYAGGSSAGPTCVAVTDADGTFTVRGAYNICLVGARARGFAASQLHFRMTDKAGTETVRIELLAAGGAVEGIVLGPDGKPVADALVRVGEGRTEDIRSTPQGAPPLPAQVRTDAGGRFVAIGVPVGTQPILARAADLASWRGTCEVAAGSTTAARITLTAGGTVRGRVLDEAGNAVSGAYVATGERGGFDAFSAVTDAVGAFTFRGMSSGEHDIAGEKSGAGITRTRVECVPGGTVECELRLGTGPALRGRVVDEAGRPLAGASVQGESEGKGKHWGMHATTDAEGRFQLFDCPEGRTFVVIAGARERTPASRSGVRLDGEELVLRLARETAPRARIVGRLLRPDGTGAVGERIEPYRRDPRLQHLGESFDTIVEAADGAFAIPVPAGAWSLRIDLKDHPSIRFDDLALAAGEVHDLGVVQIQRGGTLRVDGDGVAELEYLVWDRAERFVCGIYTPVQPLRTELLAPGEYLLQVRGEGTAAQSLPFTIEAGRETALTISTKPGVKQRIEFAPPVGGGPVRSVGYVLRRDGAFVGYASASNQEHDVLTGDVWLAPGDYELSTRDREPATTVRFTVPAADPTPLRITLR